MTRHGAKNRKADAIVSYFDQQYGHDGPTLAAWQAFSRDFGAPKGQSITQCKKVKILKNVHVNIVEFVHAGSTRRPSLRFEGCAREIYQSQFE
ncbi:hypothetical protein Slin15195_G003510 [Septoria linicola]|uniref:Uncharacterized protein n=1 Tax=Septoria linicola TaxID=215465 RepID=A0A9Q9ADP3_9PEZI|nr:hypothetical protein Slin14017_G003540 [Septoria linicola]USW47032.1 hypothetical protein Slin15195_G003510 [Septoria linicola]